MSNDNQGVLFTNDKKRGGKSDADFTGQITVDGKEYWLNAWHNTSRDGSKKYISLKIRAKELSKKSEDAPSEEIPF